MLNDRLGHARRIIPLAVLAATLLIWALVSIPGVVSSTPLSARANTAESVVAQQQAVPSEVYIVGDSITYRSRHQLWALRPGWGLDGVPGRNVTRLPALLQARMALHPAPRHVVVALGANGHLGWGKEEYVAAVALLPATTRVTFTTMWRAPSLWGPSNPRLGKRADLMAQYSREVRQIARRRPNTCVFNWRGKASRRAGVLILPDGVHPTDKGRKVWARGVVRTVRKCARQPLVR